MGRPAEYVKDDNKRPIVGLSYDKATKYYFLTHYKQENDGKKLYFGKDRVTAIQRFRDWQLKTGTPSTLPIDVKVNVNPGGYDNAPRIVHENGEVKFVPRPPARMQGTVDESTLWRMARELIAKDRQKACELLGIQILINQSDIDAAKLQLVSILKNYIGKPQFKDETKLKISQKAELREIKNTWHKFESIIGKQFVVDIQKSDIRNYFETIIEEYKDDEKSTTWVKHNFERIKRLINCYIKDSDHVEYVKKLKDYCLILTPPKKVIQNPAKLITPDDFQKILSVSDVTERAIWLVSMNCAYYGIDVAALPLNCVDLDKKTIVFRRTKTGEHRSAVLWSQTVQSILDYQSDNHHEGSTLFWNVQDKAPYRKDRIGKWFRGVLEKAGMVVEKGEEKIYRYTHSNFRDSFETVCRISNNGIQNSCDAVLGHRQQGMGSNYIDPETYPQVAASACQVVHDYYFGSKK